MSMITIGSRIPYFNHATRVSHIFTAIERVSTIQFSSHYYWYSFIIFSMTALFDIRYTTAIDEFNWKKQ